MQFELKILTEDKKLKEICQLFWELKDFEDKYQFTRKIQDIAETKKMNSAQISQIALSNSELWVKCTNCETPFLVRNRNEWNKLINKEFFFENDCQKCRDNKENKEKDNVLIKLHATKNLELDRAFKAKRWELCDRDHIEVLIVISDSYTTEEINKELFRPLIADLDFHSIRWKQINKLEELGLLWIEREIPYDKKSKVRKYHILNRLREVLLKKYKDEFRKGIGILNSNRAEITSKIINSKSGFINGEFTLKKIYH